MLIGVGFLASLTYLYKTIPAQAMLSCSPAVCPDQIAPSSTYAEPLLPLPYTVATTTPEFLQRLTASSSFVVDDATNAILWDVSSTARHSLASLTKLMSALTLVELDIPWNATTTILAADSDGSNSHIKTGETYTLLTLWKVALIGSSNTAIKALVRQSGISSTEFVARMNAKAVRLHMPTLHFVEPTGLDPQNVGTARDIARLLRFALKNDLIATTLASSRVVVYPSRLESRIVWSTNWLLTQWIPHNFVGLAVGKTGYIGDAGYNFAVRLTDGSGHSLRVVILGASISENRFTEARRIGEWVFAHTVWPTSTAVLFAPTSSERSL